MELQDVIERRYSVRDFRDTALSQKQIQRIVDAGRIAPTAKNVQPQHVWVVTSPEDLAKIDETTSCRYNAPCVLIVGYDADEAFTHGVFGGEDWSFGEQDAAIVTTQMMLKAYDIGLGSCWVGACDFDKLQELFEIPANYKLRALLPIGVPGETCIPSPRHADRKPEIKTVTWL